MHIAALDNEPRQLELVRIAMADIGHQCHGFEDGASLQRALREQSFDMLILDWRLSDNIQGRDVVKWIREHLGAQLPILFVARRRKEEDIEALAIGADDFVSKPIRVAELQARVAALLRRAYPSLHEKELVVGPYQFFPLTRTLHIQGVPAQLKYREYELAIFLFRNLGRMISRERLLQTVWAGSSEAGTRSIDTHMSRLRSKLDLRPNNGFCLSAVYGLGYRLELIDNNAIESPYPAASLTA